MIKIFIKTLSKSGRIFSILYVYLMYTSPFCRIVVWKLYWKAFLLMNDVAVVYHWLQ